MLVVFSFCTSYLHSITQFTENEIKEEKNIHGQVPLLNVLEQSSSIPNWFVKSTRARWDVGAKIRLNLPRATSLLIPMNQDTSSNIKCRGSRKTANYRWPRYLSTSISINGEAGGGTGWSRVWILRDREWEQRPGIDGCGTSRMWGQVWPGSLVRQCHGTMPWL